MDTNWIGLGHWTSGIIYGMNTQLVVCCRSRCRFVDCRFSFVFLKDVIVCDCAALALTFGVDNYIPYIKEGMSEIETICESEACEDIIRVGV